MKQLILALLVCASLSHAQLTSIYRNTKEVHRGTAAQRGAHSCLTGDLWFTTDANAGQNWFGCTGPDTWAQMGGKLPFIDVTATPYNAKGDGTTDDTAAIQAAYQALPVQSGRTTIGGNPVRSGTLMFPAGKYLVSQTILVSGGVHLVGAGGGDGGMNAAQIILKDGSATTTEKFVVQIDPLDNGGMSPNETYNTMIQNLTVDCRGGYYYGTNTAASGILFYGAEGSGLDNVTVNNCGIRGLVVGASAANSNDYNSIDRLAIAGVTKGPGLEVHGSNHHIGTLSVVWINNNGTYTDTDGDANPAILVKQAYGVNIANVGVESSYLPIKISGTNGVHISHAGIFPGSRSDYPTGILIRNSQDAEIGSWYTFSAKPNVFAKAIDDKVTGVSVPGNAIDYPHGGRYSQAAMVAQLSAGTLAVTTLAGSGNRCLETDASGIIVVAGTGAACGSGSGGTGTFQSTITDLKPTSTSTVLTIAAGPCWGAVKSASTATITAGSGNGSYAAYCTDTQAIVVEHSTAAGLTVTGSGLTVVQVTTPSVPEGAYDIATGTISSGHWDTPTDKRDPTKRLRVQNGTGMNSVVTAGVLLNQVNTATVQMKSDNYTPVADFDASAATKFVLRKGTSDPATCTVGEKFFNTTSNAEKTCTAANTWAASGGTGTASANGVYLQISGVNYLMPGMYAATLPSTTGFSWINQASATATVSSGTGYALVLSAPGGSSGWHIYKKSLGATTKVTVAFSCFAPGDSSAQSGCGFGVSASGTSNALEMLRLTFHNSAPPYRFDTVSTYTNPTSFNANLGTVNTGYLSTLLTYAQLQLSGGTLTFRTSPDGTNWTDRYSGTAASDLGTTPTEWWVGPLAATGPAQMVVYSMKEE